MNSPDVIGSDLAPMPTADDRKGAWRRLYIARMVSRGVDVEDAMANFEAVGFDGPHGFDLSESPEDTADAEMEYWCDE